MEIKERTTETKENGIWNYFKEVIIGIYMSLSSLIPGVSASTFLVLTNRYEKSVSELNGFLKSFGKSLLFFLPILIGLLVGAFLGLTTYKYIIDVFPFSLICFFGGSVIGSMPAFIKGAKEEKINIAKIIILIVAIAIPVTISLVAIYYYGDSSFSTSEISGVTYPLFVLIGFFMALFSIIPGLSASLSLILINYYENIITLLSFDAISAQPMIILLLVCLVIGYLLGIYCFARIIYTLINKYRGYFNYATLGFSIGSIFVIFFNPITQNLYIDWDNNAYDYIWDFALGIVILLATTILAILVFFKSNRKPIEGQE